MTILDHTRKRKGRITALAVTGVLAMGTLAVASQSAYALEGANAATAAPAPGVTAPEGLTVDIGSCFSSVQCASLMGGEVSQFEPIDLTTLSDWDSALDDDYTPFISSGANGVLIVVRNDGAEDITLSDMPNNATLLNHNTGVTLPWSGEGGWADTTLKSGEFIVLRPNTMAFGALTNDDPGDYDRPTDYTWSLKTDKGDVEATWSGTPTGSWNTAIVDAVINPDSEVCEAGAATGKLTFTVSYTPSDNAVTWAKTVREFIDSPEYNGDENVMMSIAAGLGGMIHLVPDSADFEPVAAGWKQDGLGEELFAHLTDVTRSHPAWMDEQDPSFFSNNGIDVNTANLMTVTEPWPDDGIAPEITLTISELPIRWTNPDTDRPAEFNLSGESIDGFSGASFAATSGAVIQNPCAVVPEEPKPSIDISKNVEGEDSQVVASGTHPVIVTIVNDGEESLTDFTFEDTTEAGNYVIWSEDELALLAGLTLEPGEEFVLNGTILVETETHRDKVLINASGVISGLPVNDDDPTEYVPEEPVVTVPSIDISKNAEGDDSQTVKPGEHEVTVRIINNGDEPLTSFVFNDTTESGADVVWNQDDLAALAELVLQPGAEFLIHGTVLVEEANHRDIATVNATGTISGLPVDDADPTEYVPEEPVIPVPNIDISKNAEGDDKTTVEIGEHPVSVTIVNTGDEALTDFTFDDTTESGNTVTWSEEDLAALDALTLEPGDTFVVNGTVLVEDGTHRDNVVIDATGAISGLPVNDEDPTELVPAEKPEVPVPGIDVSKNEEGDDSQVVKAGEHEVLVTIVNNGDDTLKNFTFTDTTESGHDVVWAKEDLASLATLSLEPGESFVVHGTVLVESGSHRDEVTINATGMISGLPADDADKTEYVLEKPAVQVPVKETPKPEALATTGGEIAPWLFSGAAATLLAGGVLLVLSRRRADNRQS